MNCDSNSLIHNESHTINAYPNQEFQHPLLDISLFKILVM